jgi:GR25 family glycosyltransferase involved in LPS biosynthesis
MKIMNILNKLFDKIYIINLESRKDRWDVCEEILDKYNIVADRFEAVDGSKLIEYPTNKRNYIGCALSHLGIIRKCKSENTDTVLIFEDDFELIDDFFDKIEDYYNQLPNDWEWLYFSGSHIEEPIKITENVFKINKTLALHAYALKQPIYDIIIDVMENSREFSSKDQNGGEIDAVLSTIQKNEKCYGFIPHLAYQRRGYSDIQKSETFYPHLKSDGMGTFTNKIK